MAAPEEEFNLQELYNRIDELKKEADSFKPLAPDVEGRIMQKFRLDWNYNSNAIEGNKLTRGETIAFLMEGLTAKGKPFKDHLDIKGHDEAIDFLFGMIKQEHDFTEVDIRNLHTMILVDSYETDAVTDTGIKVKKKISLGAYKTMPNHVKTVTGKIHYYASPEETPAKMNDLMEWYYKAKDDKAYHALTLAAIFHHRFTAIHPFDDGNGRLGRLLMNLILLKRGFPPIIVKQEDKDNYYSVLNQADNGIDMPLVDYLGKLLIHSLEIYVRGAKGENIEEPSDIDKEIALFKKGFESEDKIKSKRGVSEVKIVVVESIFPLIKSIIAKCHDLDELFESHEYAVSFNKHNQTGTFLRLDIENSLSTMTILGNHDFFPTVIRLECKWRGFKKSEEPFDNYIEMVALFGEYKYGISDRERGEVKIGKFYHEKFTNIEIEIITTEILRDAMRQIKQRIGPSK